ncbi:hypothetical protein P43SY_001247 [Pythium insidiosum]|uniref:Acyl-CoA synthetase n=1 Tax=Pythium insidiosum TaxID=114742 RepID=A0AAD5LCD2_PYTIN|nr:hypothetical protein P43SY_001247 [Pythium insidiosum]
MMAATLRLRLARRLIWTPTRHQTTAAVPHLFDRLLAHGSGVAVVEAASAPWSFAALLRASLRLSDEIQRSLPRGVQGSAHEQPRVAYLGARGTAYVTMQWATWLAGGIGVPLHAAHPGDELQYLLEDSGAALLLVSDDVLHADQRLQSFVDGVERRGRVGVLRRQPLAYEDAMAASLDAPAEDAVRRWTASKRLWDRSNAAHIVYTSGTTGRPKGVVMTHAGLTAQIHDVVTAWEMTARDHLLHFLPLHHVHGILNNLLCVHYAGGSVEFLPSAKAPLIWSRLAEQPTPDQRSVTMLMAVPTIYMNLLEDVARPSGAYDVQRAVQAARDVRVAISGSMACPVSILNRWHELTGHRLLERYGMTELGMVLTNPLHGERHLGFVGQPFPSVQARLVDPETESPIDLPSEQEGELRVRGPTVFREYWGKPDATAREFDADGWFKTGDIAQYSAERQSFRIRGRASADIIKTGGYKISALDVERVLLTHPQVRECAVFGLPDEKWGQIVAVVLRSSAPSELPTPDAFSPPLPAFAKQHLADYRVPRRYFLVDEIPKNAMGKVNKKALAQLFADKA